MSLNIQHNSRQMNALFVHSTLDDYPLTPEEFRVYAHISRRAGSGQAWPKVESVAQVCRMHPDTARRCLHALTHYGMIKAQQRRGFTTLYTITTPSHWKDSAHITALQKLASDAGTLRRAARQGAQLAKAGQAALSGRPTSGRPVANPSETKGEAPSVPTPSERRETTPSERREGYPSETKGGEGDPLKSIHFKEEISTHARTRETAKASPPDGPFSAALQKLSFVVNGRPDGRHSFSSSSFFSKSLKKPEQTQPEAANSTTNGVAPDQQLSAEQEPQSPYGEASPSLLITDENLAKLFSPNDVNDSSFEEVAGAGGGAAAAEVAAAMVVAVAAEIVPPCPELPPLPACVWGFAPVVAPELASRLPAPPMSELRRLLENLLGKHDLPVMLSEKTRSGGLPRERWLLLLPAEVRAVEQVALTEHAAAGTSLRTLVARGLDRLIGSPWNGQKKAAGYYGYSAPAPMMGGRTLEMYKKPEPEPEVPEEGKFQAGAQYRRKLDGTLVALVEAKKVKNRSGTEGMKWLLSDGGLIGALDLTLKFEFIGRATP